MRNPLRVPALLLALLAPSGCLNLQLRLGPEALEESVVRGETGPKILLLDVDGLLSERAPEDELFLASEGSSVAVVRENLDRAREDAEVRALLLRINSPGGTAAASDLVYREIRRFRDERDLPVVAWVMGTAVSGGYYVAMAADEVVAHPTSVTGSIGVIFFGINVSGLMEKLGIADQTLTAGAHKDLGSPLRPMQPVEREKIQAVLDDLHARFKQVVATGRPKLDRERVDALSDGTIYSADAALRLGLVDAVGDLEDAIAATERRAGLSTSRVVTYHRPREWKQNVYARPLLPTAIRVELAPSIAGRLVPPGFYFLWAPGVR